MIIGARLRRHKTLRDEAVAGELGQPFAVRDVPGIVAKASSSLRQPCQGSAGCTLKVCLTVKHLVTALAGIPKTVGLLTSWRIEFVTSWRRCQFVESLRDRDLSVAQSWHQACRTSPRTRGAFPRKGRLLQQRQRRVGWAYGNGYPRCSVLPCLYWLEVLSRKRQERRGRYRLTPQQHPCSRSWSTMGRGRPQAVRSPIA